MIAIFLVNSLESRSSSRGTPNQRMLINSQTKMINPSLVPTSNDAIALYRQCGGFITETSNFGEDPIAFSPTKCAFRQTAFKKQFPSFETIYHELVNMNDKTFQDGLICFIDLTFRLTH